MGKYRETLPKIELSGPTLFATVIKQIISNITTKPSPSPVYNILMIVTDGEIHDMDLTKELLVQASKLALSVIIIGVGKEQFLLMNALDSDGALLRDAQGNAALRDIVQFVKF